MDTQARTVSDEFRTDPRRRIGREIGEAARLRDLQPHHQTNILHWPRFFRPHSDASTADMTYSDHQPSHVSIKGRAEGHQRSSQSTEVR